MGGTVQARQQGFTLIELLVAAAVGLIVLGTIAGVLNTSLRIQARENQNVPVQQALRGSTEVIAQDLRAAAGPRVMYPNVNGAGAATPPGLPVSTGTSLTILVPQPNSTFAVPRPSASVGVLGAGPSTPTAPSTLSEPGASSSSGTASPRSCPEVFQGSDYGVRYSTLNTNFYTGAARSPDASRVFLTDPATPCLTGAVSHPGTPLPQANWNANTYVVKVRPVRYYVSGDTLYRDVIGEGPQVVAYGISSLRATYLPDNPVTGLTNCSSPTTYVPVPACAPRSVALTLTAVPQRASVPGARALSASQIVFLR